MGWTYLQMDWNSVVVMWCLQKGKFTKFFVFFSNAKKNCLCNIRVTWQSSQKFPIFAIVCNLNFFWCFTMQQIPFVHPWSNHEHGRRHSAQLFNCPWWLSGLKQRSTKQTDFSLELEAETCSSETCRTSNQKSYESTFKSIKRSTYCIYRIK